MSKRVGIQNNAFEGSNETEVNEQVAKAGNFTSKKNKKEKQHDEWAIDWDDKVETVKWRNMTTGEKWKAVFWNTTKVIFAILCLYIFICSISLLGAAFQILAGKTAGKIFSNNSFLNNPITGLIMGVLVTVLVQSSSTSTSIITTMVAAGIVEVRQAIPIIMGANIGTTVTNTIVALTQSIDKAQFKKAFAGATIHDIFNLLCVLVFLPLELVSGFLEVLTGAVITSFHIEAGPDAPDLLKVITKPVIKGIVKVNKTIIQLAAEGVELESEASMITVCCEKAKEVQLLNVTDPVSLNTTLQNVTVNTCARICVAPDDFLFANTGLSDPIVGVILLFVSLIILSACLVGLVKTLSSILKGTIAKVIKKVINSDFDYPFGWVTGYLAIITGAGLTFIVQSSSVFTSTITPLVGLGIIGLKRMYPLTLGSNIGTTTTSILAALASDPDRLENALQIALVHLFFNIFGILLWYPIPFMRLPIRGAKVLGMTAAKYRWFAVLYLLNVFFIIPAIVLGCSFVNVWFAVGVVVFALTVTLVIIVMNVLMSRKPEVVPAKMRNWDFLPLWMHSLDPCDRMIVRFCGCCWRKRIEDDDDDSIRLEEIENGIVSSKVAPKDQNSNI